MTPRLRTLAFALLAAAGALAPAAAGAQGVTLAVTPGVLAVKTDSVFTVSLQVTQAGDAFNAFDATVAYDTATVAFQQASPLSKQIGALMTGACANSPFHVFSHPAGTDSLSISVSLLCANVSVTGPGTIYKLTFKASHTPHAGWIRIRRAAFYNAGLFVAPPDSLWTTDAFVSVGGAAAVPPPAPAAGALRLRAGPNPATGAVALALEGRAAGEGRIEVHDALGRLVRRVATPEGVASAAWDGRDDAGRALPAGLYLVSWRAGEAVARARVVLVR